MEKEHGIPKMRALAKYQSVVSLDKAQAREILQAVFPDAPNEEVTRAVLLCASYQLNPLMKHVFLIPFNKGKDNESWATVIGIKAKRLLASRRGNYSYIDNTPRVMTKEEQVTIFGEPNESHLTVITKLKDPATSAEAVGYGTWPMGSQPYGTDKGNSKFNMASIRAESQALDRLRPGEMPMGIEVMPEEFIEAEYEVKEELASEPVPELAPEAPPVDPEPPPEPETSGVEPEPTIEDNPVTKEDIAQLEKLMKESNVSASQLGAYMNKDKSWGITELPSLKKWQFNELIAAFTKGKE